jgi:CRP-like cAMP-binding protein
MLGRLGDFVRRRTVILDSLKEGGFFGELSLLDCRSRSAMVTALTDVKMLFLPRDTFLTILRQKTEIAINLLWVMANRLRKTNESIETLTFLDVAGRVSKFILDLARKSGERDQDGRILITLHERNVAVSLRRFEIL